MNTYWKFGAIVAVIVGVLVWLAMGGVTESKTYYKEIKEFTQMGDLGPGREATCERLRGTRLHRSQRRTGDLYPASDSGDAPEGPGAARPVVYSGIDPLPNFKDNAQALADGRLGQDGVFHASKVPEDAHPEYEAKPQMKTEAKPARNKMSPKLILLAVRSTMSPATEAARRTEQSSQWKT